MSAHREIARHIKIVEMNATFRLTLTLIRSGNQSATIEIAGEQTTLTVGDSIQLDLNVDSIDA